MSTTRDEGGRVFIYDSSGRRLATEAETREFRAFEVRRRLAALEESNRVAANHKAMKEFIRKSEARGLGARKTLGIFAWREREGKAGPVTRTVSANPTIPESWDYAPPGEPTFYRRMPVLKTKNAEWFDAVAILKRKDGTERIRVLGRNFTRDCGDASCGKPKCARCWIRNAEHLQIGPDEVTDVLSRDGTKPVVYDPAGVPARGTKKSRAKSLTEDQRQTFSLSTGLDGGKTSPKR